MPSSAASSLVPRRQIFRARPAALSKNRGVGTKPGLWTLDWTMDWIMDSILDLILDRTALCMN